MVEVKYIGDIYPTRVKAKGSQFYIENTGDVIDVNEDVLEHLLKNKDFELVEKSQNSKKEKKKEKVIVDEVEEFIEEAVDEDKLFD